MNYMDTNYHMHYEEPQQDVLAMAFVNVQHINSVYDNETGFSNGTIYPCLNKPFMPGGMCR